MGRILQCLVCITAIMSSAVTQRGYYLQRPQIAFPSNTHEGPQGRHLQYSQQTITENLYTRTRELEPKEHKVERIQEQPRTERAQELTRIENGSYSQKSNHQSKRGALERIVYEPNDKIVFPGPTSTTKSGGPKITEECKRRGFCESNEVKNYPVETVSKLVAELGDEVKKFTLEVPDIKIDQRLGGASSEQEIPLCTINETVIHPQSLPDKDGKWWFVVNQDGNPLQGFLAELCRTENSNCSEIANFQYGYKGTCRQKYVYRMVQALDDDKNHVSKLLRLPGCCSCVVTLAND